MNEAWIAAVAALAYAVIGLLVGDRFPFSKYSMYARIEGRTRGAVLYLRAGERFVEPAEVLAVSGLDVDALDPKRVPCSQQWLVYEAMRWLSSRTEAESLQDGTELEAGYRMLEIGPDGSLKEELAVVTRGKARLAEP